MRDRPRTDVEILGELLWYRRQMSRLLLEYERNKLHDSLDQLEHSMDDLRKSMKEIVEQARRGGYRG